MKTTINKSVFCLFVLVGCNVKEKDDLNFKNLNLELSGLDFDFTKPQTQTYSFDVERDSIVNEITTEVFEGDVTSVGDQEPKILFFMLDLSTELKTVTARLVFDENEIDLTFWAKMAVCADADCLNTSMNKIIVNNPFTSFAIRRDLNMKEAQLFYKKEVQ